MTRSWPWWRWRERSVRVYSPRAGAVASTTTVPAATTAGTPSREVERELLRIKAPVLATALISPLARRGYQLVAALRADRLRAPGGLPLRHAAPACSPRASAATRRAAYPQRPPTTGPRPRSPHRCLRAPTRTPSSAPTPPTSGGKATRERVGVAEEGQHDYPAGGGRNRGPNRRLGAGGGGRGRPRRASEPVP